MASFRCRLSGFAGTPHKAGAGALWPIADGVGPGSLVSKDKETVY